MNIRFITFILLCLGFIFPSFSQDAFYNLGKSYAEEGNYEEAIRLTKLCVDYDRGNKNNLVADYCALSNYYSYISLPDSCKWYADEAIELSRLNEEIDYFDVIRLLSFCLQHSGFHKEAIEFRKEILKDIKESYGSESPLLIGEYRLLSIFSEEAEDYQMAIEYAKKEEELAYKTINIIEEGFDSSHSYESSFGWLCYVIQEYENPISGIYYILRCLEEKREAINNEMREMALNFIWKISRDNDFLDGCLAVYKEEALHGSISKKFTNLINILAEDKYIENDIHAPEYAQELYDLAMNDQLYNFFSKEDIKYLLYLLQRYYSKIGWLAESLQIGKKNIEWLKQNNYDLYGSEVSVLIFASNTDEDAEYAISLGKEILNSHRYDDDKAIIQIIYESMIEAYRRIGDEKNYKIFLAEIRENENYESLYTQANNSFNSGNLKELIRLTLKLLEYPDIPKGQYDQIISWLVISARNERNGDILKNYLASYLEEYRSYLLNHLPLMSPEEQSVFMKSEHSKSYSGFMDFALGIKDNKIEWAATKEAYNYALLSKSVLLTSQNEFRDVLQYSSDPSIIQKWTEFQQKYEKYSLQNEILKRDLINYAIQNSNYLKQLSYTWDNVRDALSEDEAAIEFIMCRNYYNFEDRFPDPIYIALVIKKEFSEPIPALLNSAIRLDILREINGREAIDNNFSYTIFWLLLSPLIQGVKTVYFSPTDLLNIIPIEYALIEPEERACDRWNLIRVTSTREVIERKSISKKEQAILYGGLNYNLDKEELINQSRKGTYHPSTANRAAEMENLRYGVKDLPGSLNEVKEIAKYFPTSPQVITGIFGTEESFKALAASSMDIIHLATHGFFWNKEDVEKRDYVNFFTYKNHSSMSDEENAMLRSGLIFSGANVGLMGESLPEDVEDGVLTALELSNLNLGNVDLVVMSACESGLGEISSEGVFGLQRGFKMAGANSLLMSLWKVNDHATQKLMTEFYKNYLGGMTKQESFHKAQMVLREDPVYSDPEYWAAFILLDALN